MEQLDDFQLLWPLSSCYQSAKQFSTMARGDHFFADEVQETILNKKLGTASMQNKKALKLIIINAIIAALIWSLHH